MSSQPALFPDGARCAGLLALNSGLWHRLNQDRAAEEGPSMGKVYLVGAGPGDPELLTLKAVRALQEADVILYDRLVGPEVLTFAAPQAERIYVGKEAGEQHLVQEQIMALLVAYARQGKTVVRLKGGDPLVFGRGGEEWQVLRERGVTVELIPGISSAVAVPGRAGIPLTFRGMATAFAVVTGHCQKGRSQDWSRYAGIDTLVILMGVTQRASIAQALIEAGRPPEEPVAFIERGTTPQERVVVTTLAAVAHGRVDVRSPAVFVVGQVVKLREKLVPLVEELVGAG